MRCGGGVNQSSDTANAPHACAARELYDYAPPPISGEVWLAMARASLVRHLWVDFVGRHSSALTMRNDINRLSCMYGGRWIRHASRHHVIRGRHDPCLGELSGRVWGDGAGSLSEPHPNHLTRPSCDARARAQSI